MTAPLTTPLWPKKIEVMGLSGEFESGKTRFALGICPGPQTLLYDFEKSAGTYDELGHHRVDVPSEVLRKYPKGATSLEVFEWWLAHVRSVPPGKYRVIVIDTANDIEAGLVDYVAKNPTKFGRSSGQYLKM